MSKLDYRHIDLDGATLVQRSHKRQVTPPGMWSVNNMYLSRSDNNPSLRPDIAMATPEIYAISDDIAIPNPNRIPDIVNSISGLYGSDALVYFTSYIPWASVAGVMAIASETFTTGTVTGSLGSHTVNFAALGVDVELDQEAWRGSLLKLGSAYYVIDQVIASTPAAQTGTAILTSPLLIAQSGASFTLYSNHNSYRAAFNKINIQQNGAYTIYSTPDIATAVSATDISGPFAAIATETDWSYGTFAHYHETELLDDREKILTHPQANSLASDGTAWIKVTGPVGDAGYSSAYIITDDITEDDSWSAFGAFDFPTEPLGVNMFSIHRDSTLGFLCAVNVDVDNGLGYPAVAWSSDSGDTWTFEKVQGFGTSYDCIDVAYDGTTMTAIVQAGRAGAGGNLTFWYTTDLGSTWNATTGVAGTTTPTGGRIKYVNGYFVILADGNSIYYSANGQSFTAKDINANVGAFGSAFDIDYNNGDGGSDAYVVSANNAAFTLVTAATINGVYSDVTPPTYPTGFSIAHNPYMFYDIPSARFLTASPGWLVQSVDYGANWRFAELPNTETVQEQTAFDISNMDYAGEDIGMFVSLGYTYLNPSGGWSNYPTKWFTFDRSYITSWEFEGNGFAPVSDDYRATDVAVLDGYTVLVGTRDFEEPGGTGTGFEWVYYPRRVRWSVAGSPVDFTGTGSGTGDLRGAGALLRAITVNGRIVIFETVAVGALIPRGDSTDPWDYDIIDEHFRFLSNPVAVGDICFVVASDGLLYTTDGISEMTELGASFDLNEFDDFDETKPVWLIYSREFNSILCYYRDTSSEAHPAYMINVSNGGVSKMDLPHLDDSDDELAEVPGSVLAIENSSEQGLMASYGPTSDDTDVITLSMFDVSEPITGKDVPIYRGSANQFSYWYADLETGELYITEEGKKSSVKHLIAETYVESSSSSSSARPWLAAEVKSIEDSDFSTSGDVVGTATMTTSALTGVGTAWSNKIADGDTVTVTFTLPCQAKLARVYILNGGTYTLQTLTTDYTISGNDITFVSAPGAADDVYAFWDAYPEVQAKIGDMFKSSEGWHRMVSIEDATHATCEHYLSTGSETVTHYPAWQLDDGHSRVEIGIGRLVEGVQIRLYIIPEYNSTPQPEIVKITGLSIGYVPQGRKILKATGS